MADLSLTEQIAGLERLREFGAGRHWNPPALELLEQVLSSLRRLERLEQECESNISDLSHDAEVKRDDPLHQQYLSGALQSWKLMRATLREIR
jgi:hypothetical protein